MCMGRLSQIQKTLPLNLSQGYSIIFVDWSCPQKSGQWVKNIFPSVPVIEVKGERYFSMSKPRNRGLELVETPFVAFLDGDVFFKSRASQWMEETLKGRPRWALLYGGSVVVPTDICREIGGWDECFEGWGGEDSEFWERMLTRATQWNMPWSCWTRLAHSEESRVTYFRHKDKGRTNGANHNYRELLKQYRADGVTFTPEQRKKIYACIQSEWGLR